MFLARFSSDIWDDGDINTKHQSSWTYKEMIATSQLRKKCNIMQMYPMLKAQFYLSLSVSFVKTTSCTIMID